MYQTKENRRNNKIDLSEKLEIICSSNSENDTDCSEDEDRENNEEAKGTKGTKGSETTDKNIGGNKCWTCNIIIYC